MYIRICIGILLVLILIAGYSYKQVSMIAKVDYKVFLNKKGEWNYDIYVNNSLFIRQNYLPAVKGNCVIKSSEEAVKLAKAIVYKIEQGKNPAITINELKEMNILSNRENCYSLF